MGLFFRETGLLISERKEITAVSTFGFKDFSWMSTSSLCEKAYQIPNAKTYVFPDSVLCVEKTGDDPIAEEQKLNSIRKTITSRIRIESTECRRSSSGNYSQESQRWASSRRPKTQRQTCSVSLTREMGSPRHWLNRRRGAREGPEPARVQTPLHWGWHCRGGRAN